MCIRMEKLRDSWNQPMVWMVNVSPFACDLFDRVTVLSFFPVNTAPHPYITLEMGQMNN